MRSDDVRSRNLRNALLGTTIGRLGTVGIFAASIGVAGRELAPAPFGLVMSLAGITLVLGLLDLGVGSHVVSLLGRVSEEQTFSREVRREVGNAFTTTLVIALALVGIGFASAVLGIGHNLVGAGPIPKSTAEAAVFAAVLCAALSLCAAFIGRIAVGAQRATLIVKWETLGAAMALGALVALSFTRGPLWLYVALLSGVAPAVTIVGVLFEMRRTRLLILGAFNCGMFARQLSLGSPYFVINVGIAVSLNVDALLTTHILGPSAAAVVAVAARMFGVVRTTLSRASIQLWSATAAALERGEASWVRRGLLRSMANTGVLGAVGAVPLGVLGPIIVDLWVGAGSVGPRMLYLVHAVWTVYSVMVVQLSYVLNALGALKVQVVMVALMATTNVALTILLTQRIGVIGPVVASLASHVVIVGAPSVWYLRRSFRGSPTLTGTRHA